jgi:Secretion system C-terminal sorting domain
MTLLKRIITLSALLLSLSYAAVSQNGPGGVGNAGGTFGQPKNTLWLRAGSGISQSAGLVNSWADQSGNAFSAVGTGGTRPSFVATDPNFNSLPVIDFSPTATNKNLVINDNDQLDNTIGLTMFAVFRSTDVTGDKALLSKRTSSGVDQSYMMWINTSDLTSRIVNDNAAPNINTLGANTTHIGGLVFNGALTNPRIFNYLNGGLALSANGPASIPNNASNLHIGAFDVSGGETRNLAGRMAEILVYTTALNDAQRQIVENYLSAKYNTTLAAGDVYAGDASGFDFDVIGIGRAAGQSHIESIGSGFQLSTYNGTIDTDGEFVMAGHNNTANTVVNCACAGYPVSIQQRWGRTWFVDKTTAGSVDAAIAFDFSDGIAGQFPQDKDDYELLYSSDGGTNFSIVSILSADKSISGDKMIFRVANASLADGIYTLGTTDAAVSPVNGLANRTWYSYQTGNWENPLSWTLDGGVIPLYVNPSAETPSASDNVVITSGRTITITTNTKSTNNIEVNGTLNIAATSGHAFTNIAGTGRIRFSGAGGVDNFPSGVTTEFANATTGGTVEVFGTGITLSQNRTLNDLIINLTSGNASITASSITLNGDLNIQSGTLRFNDGVAATPSTIAVSGNVVVESTGLITVAANNVRHQFNLQGDFTNDGGVVQFTNRGAAVFTSEATDGIVDFNLLSGIRNQNVVCNGVTRFYRIRIDKGTDDTYLASFSATAAGNFLLFGFSNEDHASTAQLANTANSFALIRGTAEIRTNISIPVLSNTGNYNISAGATLWVNGGSVLKNNGNSTVPYGKLRVSAGTFESRVVAGITTRDNGTIIVEGGVVNTNQIRTSVLGASNVGGYVQTGGTVTVDGGGPGGTGLDFYVFSLTYTGNVFQMSGGTLLVRGSRPGTATTRGGIFINSDPANVSVTGGTVIAEISNTNPYRLTSRAPFWNLILRNTTGASLQVDIEGGTSGPNGGGASEITLPAQNLVVRGGLTIENNVVLDHNAKNINIAGNLIIQATGDLLFDNTKQNTTTFDGTDNATLTFLNRTLATTTDEQRFWNFVINKPADKIVSLASGKTGTSLNGSNNNLLRIEGNAFKLFSGTLDQGFHSIRMYCDTILNYQTVGLYNATSNSGAVANDRNDLVKLRDDNSATKLLTINTSVFGPVRLNSGDDPIELVSNVKIRLLEYNFGKVNLKSFNLAIDDFRENLNAQADSLSEPPGGGITTDVRRFSVEDMLTTNGSNSDGGLSIYVPAGTANGTRFVFPLGIGSTANDVANTAGTDKYTPAFVTISGLTGDDGYITINPVNTALDLLNGFPNNMLQYYWNVEHSGFTSVPNVRLQFTYNGADDNNGTVTNYVPGRVINFSTRQADAGGVAAVRETINEIAFTTGALTTGLYTAAEPAAFTGTIQVFFNRENGETGWNDNNKWSLIGFNGTATTDEPGPGDVVRLRNNDGSGSNNSWVNLDVNTTVAAVIFDNTGGGWRPRISVNSGQVVSLGVVEGEGEIFVRANAGSIANLTDTDIGDFANQANSFFIYNAQDNNTYSMNTSITTYPNLRIEGSNGGGNNGLRVIRNTIPIIVKQDMWVDWGGTFLVEANLQILRDLLPGAGGGGGGTFEFGNNGNHTVTITRDISITNNANNRILVRNDNTSRLHVLSVGRSIIQAQGQFTLFNGTGTQNNAILDLIQTTNGTYTRTAGTVPSLFRIVMDKGTDITSTFSFEDTFTLGAVTNVTTKPIELNTGLLILNDVGITTTLSSGGGNFNIRSGSGLEVRAGTANLTGSDTGILLDGLLRVSGINGTDATVNIDDAGGNGNNFIEYSASGSAILEITNGRLTVGSQIRRGLTSTAGILKYRQSGGAVVVGRRAAPTTNRGVFEVINTGSEFTHTAGTLTIVRGINSTTIPSLLLEPQTPTVFTNSTIIIGSANTPAGVNGQNIGIRASGRRLGTLTIDNTSGNNPRVLEYSSALSIDGTFTINTGASFDANGFGLNLRGNMVVNGTYVPSGNTTFFLPTATRSLSGTGTINFFNFTKSLTLTLNVLSPITITNDLAVTQGTLADNGNKITLLGNASFGSAPATTGTHTSIAGGQGLTFAGSTQQQLSCLRTDGVASLGIVSIDNPSGVVIPDQSEKFTINNRLRLVRGVLDIGGSLLTLASSTDIEQVNTFSVNNMIQTNSSFTDNGVTKIFPAGTTADFTFPIGQSFYTPVTFDFADIGTGVGAGTTSPSITVRPANERQPIIIEDTESGACTVQINDLSNVLQYHWIVTATNTNDFESNVFFQYDQNLVALANGLLEADYLAARVRTSDNTVFKFPGNVNAATNTINFQFNDVTQSDISGEYLAGIDCAIPNAIVVYTTLGGGLGNGNVNNPAIYVGNPSPLTLSGAAIVVSAGDNVAFPSASDNIILYRTEILGTLEIESGSIGHRLGTVTGTGTLRLEVNAPDVSVVLPAGFYNDFFSCTGGGLEYGGDTSYEVLGGITSLRRLNIDGTGTRTLSNNDILICEDLTLTGPTFVNTNNRNITVQRDLILSSGSFSTGTSTLEVDRDLLVAGGTFNGQTAGTKLVGNDLVVTGGTFTAGSGGTLTILGDLNYTAGTFSGGSGTHKTVFQGTVPQTTSGNFTLHRLEIDNTQGLTLGGNVTVNNELLLTNGNITPGTTSFILASSAAVTPTEGQATSFVNGRLRKVMPQGATFVFPIGKNSRWRYASVINPTSVTTTTWEFEYYDQAATTTAPLVTNLTPSSSTIKTISSGEFWRVSTGATSNTATIGLSWGIESDVNASSVERQDLVVMLWNDGTSLWDSRGGTNFSSGNTQSRGSFNSSSTISFSEQVVTLGSTDVSNPLPVVLVQFTGRNQGGVNKISWKTASELNNDYFIVERSGDGESFTSIGRVNGQGTTSQATSYNLDDEQPFLGNNYYRLKQTDFNGEFSYSDVILVKNESSAPIFTLSVYPNPALLNKTFKVQARKDNELDATVIIRDIAGRVLESYSMGSGFDSIREIELKNAQAGIYLIELNQGAKRIFKRLIIE